MESVIDCLGYDWIAGLEENCRPSVRQRRTNIGETYLTTSIDQNPDILNKAVAYRQYNDADFLSTSETSQRICPDRKGFSLKKFSTTNELRKPNNNEDTDSAKGNIEVFNFVLNSRLFPIPADIKSAKMGPLKPGVRRVYKVRIPLHLFRQPALILDDDNQDENEHNLRLYRSMDAINYQALIQRLREQTKLSQNAGMPVSLDPLPKPGEASLLAHCILHSASQHNAKSSCSSTQSRYGSAMPKSSLRTSSPIGLRAAINYGPIRSRSKYGETAIPLWLQLQPRSEQEAIHLSCKTSKRPKSKNMDSYT